VIPPEVSALHVAILDQQLRDQLLGSGGVHLAVQARKLLNYTKIAGRAPDSMIKEESKKAEEVYPAKWQQWSSKTGEQKALLTIRAEDSE
jgi:hypothetical protein